MLSLDIRGLCHPKILAIHNQDRKWEVTFFSSKSRQENAQAQASIDDSLSGY